MIPKGLPWAPMGNLHIYADGSKNITIHFLTLRALSSKSRNF